MWSGKRADCSPGQFRLQSVTHSSVLESFACLLEWPKVADIVIEAF